MTGSIKSQSKFLIFVLHQKPDPAGLTLDPCGWAEIDALIGNAAGRLTRAQPGLMDAGNNKQRSAISDDSKRRRARQGHSIPVDLGLEPVEPPEQSIMA